MADVTQPLPTGSNADGTASPPTVQDPMDILHDEVVFQSEEEEAVSQAYDLDFLRGQPLTEYFNPMPQEDDPWKLPPPATDRTLVAIERYNDKVLETCENVQRLVNMWDIPPTVLSRAFHRSTFKQSDSPVVYKGFLGYAWYIISIRLHQNYRPYPSMTFQDTILIFHVPLGPTRPRPILPVLPPLLRYSDIPPPDDFAHSPRPQLRILAVIQNTNPDDRYNIGQNLFAGLTNLRHLTRSFGSSEAPAFCDMVYFALGLLPHPETYGSYWNRIGNVLATNTDEKVSFLLYDERGEKEIEEIGKETTLTDKMIIVGRDAAAHDPRGTGDRARKAD